MAHGVGITQWKVLGRRQTAGEGDKGLLSAGTLSRTSGVPAPKNTRINKCRFSQTAQDLPEKPPVGNLFLGSSRIGAQRAPARRRRSDGLGWGKGWRIGLRHPSLRTGRADFPHPALQSVSSCMDVPERFIGQDRWLRSG